MAPVSSSPLVRLTLLSLATSLLGSFLYSQDGLQGTQEYCLFKYLVFFLNYVCGMHMCLQVSLQTTKGVVPLWAVSVSLLLWLWEQNLGPLQEQNMFF